MNQVLALLWKDLRIHARFAGTYLVGWPILMRLLIQAQHAVGWSKSESVASAFVPTAVSFTPVFAIFLAQALIERERDKATFAWVRTLPVSDVHIVLAKFAVACVCGLAHGAAWRVAMLGLGIDLDAWQVVSGCLAWGAFTGIALFSQVLLSGRLAGAMPALLALGASGVAFRISRSRDAVLRATQAWNDPYAHVGLWVACVVVQVCAVAATYVRFHAQDAERLVE